MKDKIKTILVIMMESDYRADVVEELESQKYKVIYAGNASEARLKFNNSTNSFIIIEEGMSGFSSKDFVLNIRKKEESKSMKDCLPVLIVGQDAGEYHTKFGEIHACQFLGKPFSRTEFKKKILQFTGNSQAITENTRTIKANDYLLNEGAVSTEMYWVISGEFIITKLNQNDQNIIIGRVNPGELVGEMSFLDALPRSASVKAVTDSEVLAIPHKKFVDIYDNQPAWFRSLMKTLSKRLRMANHIMAKKQVHIDDADEESWAETENVKGV